MIPFDVKLTLDVVVIAGLVLAFAFRMEHRLTKLEVRVERLEKFVDEVATRT